MPETRTKQTETESESKSVSPPKKSNAGRPSKYDPLLAAEICTRISNGEALRQICMDENMPVQSTVYLWLSRFNEFSDMYAKAREDQADTLADEIQALADHEPKQIYDERGNAKYDPAHINWMRLRVDARKWVAAKLKPRKYGDRVALAGDEDNPLKVEASIEAKGLFNDLLQAMESRKQADGRNT